MTGALQHATTTTTTKKNNHNYNYDNDNRHILCQLCCVIIKYSELTKIIKTW